MSSRPAKACPACGERYGAESLFCSKDGTSLARAGAGSLTMADDDYVGVELPGQIVIKHLVGAGSMGRVYRAWQAGIDRDVAVKVLHRELGGNEELVTRFHREAKLASRLVHAHVVQVLMTGRLPVDPKTGAGGELYLVMEYLDGVSLLSLLAASGDALPLPRALRIGLQICDAVGEAHAQSIVHRDLKPDNIMLVRRGDDADFVKILDFGVARLEGAGSSMATQAGRIFGTAKYISPEGAEGKPAGPAADVYSIATVLFQCLAGRTPFEGDSHVALLVHHSHSEPPPLTSIERSSYVPSSIEGVIMKNLSKDPRDRAQNARELGRDLIEAARASGLDVGSLLARSSLLGPRAGALQIASRDATLALGPIALPAGSAPAGATPLPSAPEPQRGEVAAVEATSAPPSAPSFPALSRPIEGSPLPQPAALFTEARDADGAAESDAPLAHDPDDGDDDGERLALPPASRSRMARATATALIGAVTALLLFVGAKHLGWVAADSPSVDASAELDASLAAARKTVREHAWDSPPGANTKELTDRALERFPGDERVLRVRSGAAERIVSDAVAKKYAGDADRARHLARLALELSPGLRSAEQILADLDASLPAASAAPTAPPSRAAPRPGGRLIPGAVGSASPRPGPSAAPPLGANATRAGASASASAGAAPNAPAASSLAGSAPSSSAAPHPSASAVAPTATVAPTASPSSSPWL